jgi:Protein of unknown function, DUF488
MHATGAWQRLRTNAAWCDCGAAGSRLRGHDGWVGVLLTFGHGTATEERIAELLRVAGVRRLVDIRTAPGSRRSPHVSRAELQRWLREHGIAYRWEKRLGGWRKPRPDSPDAALRARPFAGYAAHMRSAEFRCAVDELLDEAAAAHGDHVCRVGLVALPSPHGGRLRRAVPWHVGAAPDARRPLAAAHPQRSGPGR